MTEFSEIIHVRITPEMFDKANKMERAFLVKKGEELGISNDSHDYQVGLLGEYAVRHYLKFNNIRHTVDDILHSDYGDKFDVKIGDMLFDVKTQLLTRPMNLFHVWNTMSMRLYAKQIRRLHEKRIHFVLRTVVNFDYSWVHIIGFMSVQRLNHITTLNEEHHDFLFRSLIAPWRMIEGYHRNSLREMI